ncbi:hypothetical protein Tco_0714040, partial [Tanacetum coccineum]
MATTARSPLPLVLNHLRPNRGFLLQLMALCVRRLEQAMKFDRVYVVRL